MTRFNLFILPRRGEALFQLRKPVQYQSGAGIIRRLRIRLRNYKSLAIAGNVVIARKLIHPSACTFRHGSREEYNRLAGGHVGPKRDVHGKELVTVSKKQLATIP